jgi:hypothetical protein
MNKYEQYALIGALNADVRVELDKNVIISI